MRRKRSWWEACVLLLLLLAVGYAGLLLAFPRWVSREFSRSGDQVLITGCVRLGVPLKLTVSDVWLGSKSSGPTISSQQIAVGPLWISWPNRTVWLGRLEVESPRLQLRRTKQGTLMWSLFDFAPPKPAMPSQGAPESSSGATSSGWRLIVQTVQVMNGTVELIDQKTASPFRWALTDLSFIGGPITWPIDSVPIAGAWQGRLVGHQHHAAFLFCSGWVSPRAMALDLSCQLEPLRLAAFEPYYPPPLRGKLTDATLKATSHFVARANVLDGKVQVGISNVNESDLPTFLGKSLADIKKMPEWSERTLTGEFQLSGPLDHPEAWQVTLVPGNEIVQAIINPLVSRGVENVQIKVGQQTIHLGLTEGSKDATSNIETTSQQVQETLKVLAPPPEPPKLSTEEPPPQSSGQPSSPALLPASPQSTPK